MSRPPSFLSLFKGAKIVGQGGFGTVYKATYRGEIVAVKVANVKSEAEQGAVEREVSALKYISTSPEGERVCTPFFVCYIDSFQIMAGDEIKYAIVSEFVDGNTLQQWIDRQTSILKGKGKGYTIQPDLFMSVALHLTRGLSYLHANNMVHRDIKPANIMYNSSGLFKYVDFGFACTIDPNNDSGRCRMNSTGTVYYAAPEVHDLYSASVVGRENIRFADTSRDFDLLKATDVWSLGITLYTLLFGQGPWVSTKVEELIREKRSRRFMVGKGDEARVSVDPNVLSVLNLMCQLRWKDRVTAAGALELFESV